MLLLHVFGNERDREDVIGDQRTRHDKLRNGGDAKIGKHCIVGKDYKQECETKNCNMRSLCRKEHDLTKGEEEFEDETHHNRRRMRILGRRGHMVRPHKSSEKS